MCLWKNSKYEFNPNLFYIFTLSYSAFCFSWFWCHMNMKKRTLSIFCDTLVKSLKTGNVLKGCHRVVTPDFVERGKRSFHTQVSSCSPTSILSQEEQHSSRTCHLPQLDVPDNPDDLFRGMSTDFPCLTRK